MQIFKKLTIASIAAAAAVTIPLQSWAKTMIVNVRPVEGDATEMIRAAFEKAKRVNDKNPVVVRFHPGVYHLSKEKADAIIYHVSNTTSESENSIPVKHVGMLLQDFNDLLIEGEGAKIVTHGEMTPWVVDGCESVTISGLTIDAADPSVPEMTVESTDSLSFVAKVHPRSRYEVSNGKLFWQGEGWEFTDGIAQLYYPDINVTNRVGSPLVDAIFVEELEPGTLRFNLGRQPQVRPGDTYQMRHSLRTEVAGLITNSKNITLDNLKLNFMGNFGIVAQVSENVTYRNLQCKPAAESGRTASGFADFLQVSGCKGLIDITGCEFAGSHDDPINVHGTHLRVSDWGDGTKITVEYMHGQTFGFQSFFPGDTIEIVNPQTLLPVTKARVKTAGMDDPRHITLILDREILPKVRAIKDAVVENITWTPSVRISNCRFSLTPTRGILLTTRRPVEITDNWFFRCPMASILIADDARSWYESGPAHNVTISRNKFVECATPVIQVAPEIGEYEAPVHKNIRIVNNTFEYGADSPNRLRGPVISVTAVDSLQVANNHVKTPHNYPLSVSVAGCTRAVIDE